MACFSFFVSLAAVSGKETEKEKNVPNALKWTRIVQKAVGKGVEVSEKEKGHINFMC